MSREGTIYTHYGHKSFEPEAFEPITNRPMFIKPFGGLWASANDAEFGWKEWNEREKFAEINDSNKIQFKLKPETRILEIHNVEDAKSMKEKYKTPMPPELEYLSKLGFGGTFIASIDFEAIAKDYDAIEFFISDDYGLYHEMYGWDCDSILVMNKDVVVPIEEKKLETEQKIADTILEDIVITPKPPTYKQDFYQIVEDVLEEEEFRETQHESTENKDNFIAKSVLEEEHTASTQNLIERLTEDEMKQFYKMMDDAFGIGNWELSNGEVQKLLENYAIDIEIERKYSTEAEVSILKHINDFNR